VWKHITRTFSYLINAAGMLVAQILNMSSLTTLHQKKRRKRYQSHPTFYEGSQHLHFPSECGLERDKPRTRGRMPAPEIALEREGRNLTGGRLSPAMSARTATLLPLLRTFLKISLHEIL
jgi:hypothetical protein